MQPCVLPSRRTAVALPVSICTASLRRKATHGGWWLLTLLLCCSGPLWAQTPGTWTAIGHMITARAGATATLQNNGKVLVTGGRDASNNPTASAELYDPATSSWKTTGSMTTPRADFTATLLPDGRVLVAGGQAKTCWTTASAELYDPTTGIWSTTGSMQSSRGDHEAALITADPLAGKVLVAGGYINQNDGGCGGNAQLSSAELYDPISGTWSVTNDMTKARNWYALGVVALPDASVLVTGGLNCCPYTWFNNAETYHPSTQLWTPTKSKTTPANGAAVLLHDDKVLVAGGSEGTQPTNVFVTSAELFDPSTGAWTATASMSTDRDHPTLTLLASGQVLIAGGISGGWGECNSLASAELYDPSAGTWSATGNMTAARFYHTATALPNGQVLVAGGNDCQGNNLSSAELYTPSTLKGGQVMSFTLIDVQTGKDIQPLREGDVLDLTKLPAQLSVRANTQPTEVGSVVFGLNGKPTVRVESFAPYALASNTPDDRYVPYAFQVGDYTLSATPYGQANGQGEKGLAMTIHFRVEQQPKVTSFMLLNAATGAEVQPLQTGDVLDLATLPDQLSVQANTEPIKVGSVVFGLNGEPTVRVENFWPYALASNKPEGSLFFLSQFGSEGSSQVHFGNPIGVALDSRGNIYVADAGSNHIVKLDSTGQFLFFFGGNRGSGEGQFSGPYGVAADGRGRLYVSDFGNHRIQVFDTSGRFLLQFGRPGSGEGQFSGPFGLAVDGSGRLYVVDQINYRIQVFDSLGRFLFKFGSQGSGAGQFSGLEGVAVDGSGQVYVVDWGNSRIQVFDSTGRFLFQFGSPGSGAGQFNGPRGVSVKGNGKVYVSDYGNHRIQVFDSSGRFLYKFGSVGRGHGQFRYPTGMAVDGSGQVYVADAGNSLIQKLSPAGSYMPYAFQSGEYVLSAIPYSQANGQGKLGPTLTVHFRVVNSASTARTSVGEGTSSLEVAVYPNPFSEQVILLLRSSASQPVVVQVYDAQGRPMGGGVRDPTGSRSGTSGGNLRPFLAQWLVLATGEHPAGSADPESAAPAQINYELG